jgi:hypothetical protein
MNRWSCGFGARRARQWLAIGLGLFAFGGQALAQWSSDPAVNTVVADGAGEQTQPKIVAAPDGSYYVSWTDAPGEYDIRLQKLDAAGNALWPHNGILVADRSFGFVYDYGLAVDSAGNALLAYHCCENNTPDEHIVAQRVSPQGNLLWGANGITVSSAGEGGLVARIAGLSDGGVAVAWANATSQVRAQKLDANGAPLWGAAGVTIAPPSGSHLLADLQASDNGNAIVSFQAQLSRFNRQLWAQKFASADGAPLWGTDPLVVSDNTSGIMQLGYFPPFVDDGAGGAAFVWYVVSGLNGGMARAQHVNAAGAKRHGANGIDLTTDATQSHYNPTGFYDRATGDIYALWQDVRITATQRYYGMSAQRVDAAGTRLWGDVGKTLLPTDEPIATSQFTALPAPGGMLAGWVTDDLPNPMPMSVTRLDNAGNAVWTQPWSAVKNGTTLTSRASGIATAEQAVYVWSDSTSDGEGDIRVQNLRYDGSLGDNDTIFKSGFE